MDPRLMVRRVAPMMGSTNFREPAGLHMLSCPCVARGVLLQAVEEEGSTIVGDG
jgi:hypothetical protein